jgi:hypothetical protein
MKKALISVTMVLAFLSIVIPAGSVPAKFDSVTPLNHGVFG